MPAYRGGCPAGGAPRYKWCSFYSVFINCPPLPLLMIKTQGHGLSHGALVKNFSHLSRYLIVIFPKYLVFIEISYKCGYHDITIYTISPSILCQFCPTSSEVVQPLEKHKNQLGEKIRLTSEEPMIELIIY